MGWLHRYALRRQFDGVCMGNGEGGVLLRVCEPPWWHLVAWVRLWRDPTRGRVSAVVGDTLLTLHAVRERGIRLDYVVSHDRED